MSVHELKPGLYFWQWDTGQKLKVPNTTDCGEVHFCNGTDDCALVVPIKTEADGTRAAEVPNILLQTAKPIRVYLYRRHANGATTRTRYIIQVIARKRPADYVYTETEVLCYKSLEERIKQIEQNGISDEQIAMAVKKYLDESGVALPAGGTEGQYLRKKSDADGDVEWADFEIPKEYGLISYDQDKTITIT